MTPSRILRSIFLALSIVACGAGIAASGESSLASMPGRLPNSVVPTHYAIDLKPDLTSLTLAGSEVVEIKVAKSTSTLTLNALKIDIVSAALDGESGQNATASFDEKAQTVNLAFPSPIRVGTHKLRIAFNARVNGFGEGLYYVDYPSGAGRKRMIATQLEPTDARRVFPCWDEPSFKASFEPSITVPRDFLAVSNMPVVREQALDGGLKRVSFQATPPMSSYLFVMVAGEMERLAETADGVDVGVVARRGDQEQGRYALETAVRLLRFYDSYFGVKYPLPKLDLIAVPGGFGGAMENWGGITFYEGALLYDPASSPKAMQRTIFAIVAHEMAHQWFGDLVTTAWWSDLWLNEGFADWMQAKAENDLHPDWQVWLNEGHKQMAMYADARPMAHPIQQPVANESEAAIAFDEITYDKGAAIIRLLENYLGEDAFRSGIRRYISDHAYGSATTRDLWTALERASGRQVSTIARGYTEQPGMPLIIAGESCRAGKRVLALRQERFVIRYPDAPPEQWQVPIDWGRAGDRKPSGNTLLREKAANISAGPCDGALKLNFGDIGYYRTQYDPATLADLAVEIEKMQPADRVNLLADSWALIEANRLAPAGYFSMVHEVENDDRTRAVWREVMGAFSRIDRLERGFPGRPAFQAYARAVLHKPFDRIGWNAAPGESEDIAILRSRLISALGDLNDSGIAAEAKRRFAQFVEHPGSLDVNLRDAVVGVAGRIADQSIYDELRKLARQAGDAHDRMRYYRAMARAVDPSLVEQTLQMTLGNQLPPEQSSELILIIAAGEHPDLALKFVKQNFAALAARRSPEFRYFFMSSLMANFAEPAYARELAAFGPVNETSGGRIEALRAEAKIMEAADFRAHQLRAINEWIEQARKSD